MVVIRVIGGPGITEEINYEQRCRDAEDEVRYSSALSGSRTRPMSVMRPLKTGPSGARQVFRGSARSDKSHGGDVGALKGSMRPPAREYWEGLWGALISYGGLACFSSSALLMVFVPCWSCKK